MTTTAIIASPTPLERFISKRYLSPIIAFAFALFSEVLFAQGVSINSTGNEPDPSAILDVSSGNAGILIPRLSTEQRNSITSPALGLQIYNTDLNCLQYFQGTSWFTVCGANCQDAPSQPTAVSGLTAPCANTVLTYSVVHTPDVVYTWQTPQGWGIISGQGSNQISVTTGSESGIVQVTPSNACGSGNPSTLQVNVVTAPSHGYIAGVTPSTNSQYTNRSYNVVQAGWGGTGGDKCWLGLNIGATAAPVSATDNDANRAGWYFQFNRKQAYHVPTSAPTPSWTITSINEDSNWTNTNDPCVLLLGANWRLPTWAEWTNFFEASATVGGMSSGDKNNAFSSALKLHTPGYLRDTDGTINVRGVDGFYWASNQASTTVGRRLIYTGSSITGAGKVRGFSVRCISD